MTNFILKLNKAKYRLSIVFGFLFLAGLVSCDEGNEAKAIRDEIDDPFAFNSVDDALLSIEDDLEAKLESMYATDAADRGSLGIDFLIVRNNRTEKIALANFEVIDYYLPWGLLFSARGGDHDEYVVSCSGGSEGDWSKSCSGTACLKLAKKCLDQGGCAEVCKAPEYKVPLNAEEFFGIESEIEQQKDESKKKSKKQLELEDPDNYSFVKMSYYPSPYN